MRLIRDFSQADTDGLLKALRSFKRTIIGLPLLFGLLPLFFVVKLDVSRLWWVPLTYAIGILIVTGILAIAHSRLVAEVEKRIT